MSQNNLINVVELADMTPIGKKYNEDRAVRAINSAQSVDLYDLLGEFVFDVIANKDNAAYTDLIQGSTFTRSGKTYQHKGLKEMLAFLSYARYVEGINFSLTPNAAVTKKNQDSEPVSHDMVRDIASRARRDADAIFSVIKLYLRENSSTFSRFNENDTPDFGTPRISVI